jgi:hypothetical protein
VTITFSANFLAQMTHVLGGALILLTGVRLFGAGAEWWTLLAGVVYAAIKECLIDPWLEGDPIWPDGCQDVAFYLVGLAAGVGILAI